MGKKTAVLAQQRNEVQQYSNASSGDGDAAMLQTPPQTSWPPHQTRRHLMYMPKRQPKCRSSLSVGQLTSQSTVKSPTPRPKLSRILLPLHRQAVRQSSRLSVAVYGAPSSTRACYLSSPCIDCI